MSNTSPSIFSRIIAREIAADIVFESDEVIAFRDVAPQAPVHILIVPKTEAYRNVAELAAGDPALLSRIVATAQLLADEYSTGDFRLAFNTGAGAGQTVFHVHAHLLAGTTTESLTEGSLAD
ncbi:MAG: histidine triad nucleotide-binding protein [Salinibacterium sp.]|nr:histidine triad nucleotide-binding protein [Salinibacterium sp.]